MSWKPLILITSLVLPVFTLSAEPVQAPAEIIFELPQLTEEQQQDMTVLYGNFLEILATRYHTLPPAGFVPPSDSDRGLTAFLNCEVERSPSQCRLIRMFKGYEDGIFDDVDSTQFSDLLVDALSLNVTLNGNVIGEVLSMRSDGTPRMILLYKQFVEYSEAAAEISWAQ